MSDLDSKPETPDEMAEPLPPPPVPPPSRLSPGLERQTLVMVNDRGRFVLLVGLCTLAGVAVGFGLSTLASNRTACQHTRILRSAPAAQLEAIPIPTPPRAQSFSFGHRGGCGVHSGHGVHAPGVHIWDDDEGFHLYLGDEEEEGYLGVNIVTADVGALITRILDDSPADAAGLAIDDVIVAFDDIDIATASQLVGLVRGSEPGEAVTLTVKRGDDETKLTTSLGSRRR